MNAFLNLFGIIFDLFRVPFYLFSATLEEVVVVVISVVTRCVAVVSLSSTWPEQTPTPTSI